VFTELAKGALTLDELHRTLRSPSGSARDFPEAIVTMRMLERREGSYANTPETDYSLDRGKPFFVRHRLPAPSPRCKRIP
jgi:hypothetical protein